MLYAKVTPSAQFIKQVTPFSSVTETAEYFTAIARPYAAGTPTTNFEVIFGNVMTNDTENSQSFVRVFASSITLTAEELINWGTNDTVMLSAVANKLGATASDFITIDRD